MRELIPAPLPGLDLRQHYGHHQSPAIRAGEGRRFRIDETVFLEQFGMRSIRGCWIGAGFGSGFFPTGESLRKQTWLRGRSDLFG